MPTATNELISRATAVQQIADHIADRDHYVITAPPEALAALAQTLRLVDTWAGYLDNGAGMILRTDRPGVLAISNLLAPAVGVITVPKTVPAAVLTEALGQEVPDDGSQDIVILMPGGPPAYFPLLFVEALDIVDPRTAAQLRAHHIPNLN